MQLSQLCAANYHYKRYTLDYFLCSVEKLGYESIELWASGPHLHLEDYDNMRLSELNQKSSMYSYVRLSIDRCTATYV